MLKKFLSWKNIDLGLLLLRLVVGPWFAFHGAQKVFGIAGGPGMDGFTGYLTSLEVPLPAVNAWMAALTELLGGLALAAGFMTRLVVIPMSITMLVAAFVAHAGELSKWELPFLYLAAFVALGMTGPGRFSVDGAGEARP